VRHSLAVTLAFVTIMVAAFAGAWFVAGRGSTVGRATKSEKLQSDDRSQMSPQGEAPYAEPDPPSGPLPEPPAEPRANMVLVPAGKFLYGDDKREIELPDYFIDRYEVSQEEYGRFLDYVRRTGDHSHCNPKEPKGKNHTPLNWGRRELSNPRWPVVGLDFWDCCGYAGWVGKRLPTEQEWEKAARGTDGRLYPWGDEWDASKVNLGPTPGDRHTLIPVDALPEGQSPYGCHHMLGNAAEWTASFVDEAKGVHCGRGCCWLFGHQAVIKTTYRMEGGTHLRDEGSGLRCALDAP